MLEALKSEKKQHAKEKLRTPQKAFLTHRQVGLSEATYRLLPGMHLKVGMNKVQIIS